MKTTLFGDIIECALVQCCVKNILIYYSIICLNIYSVIMLESRGWYGHECTAGLPTVEHDRKGYCSNNTRRRDRKGSPRSCPELRNVIHFI